MEKNRNVINYAFKKLWAALGCTLAFYSCATTPPPLWVQDAEAVYPADRYIAQKGYGENSAQAQAAGLDALSRYFVSEVSSTTRASQSYSEQNGAASLTRQVDEQVFIQSQTRLVGVRYTDPWYNSGRREWETIAYIERAEAWAMYEPGLGQKISAFENVYAAAEKEAEPLKQFHLYASARALSEDISPLLDFAHILNPGGAARFTGARDTIAGLPQKIDAARTGAVIYIECPLDFDAVVYSAFARAFGAGGFAVSRDKKTATAVCAVRVGENMQKLEVGTFYYPTLTATLTGKNGALFTYSRTLERVGAVNPDVAKRRAYNEIAREIEKSFFEELDARMSGL
jgi:hypothetical protein